jgi:hypothetical protein
MSNTDKLRMATADETAREIAWKTWLASAKIYGTSIDETQVRRLFDTWWRRNGGQMLRQVGAKFWEGVSANG